MSRYPPAGRGGDPRREGGTDMTRVGFFAALVLAAGAVGCSSTPKVPLTQTANANSKPAAAAATTAGGTGVVPAGYQTRISTFDTGKDCKT